MAKKGQKCHVARQHGELHFFVTPQMLYFHLVAFDIRNVVYLRGFKGTIQAHHVKNKK